MIDITEALLTLDQNNDDHWTARGLPDVKVISKLVGNENLKRSDIDAVDPDFARQKKIFQDDGIDAVSNSSNEPEESTDPETILAKELSDKQAKMAGLTRKKSDLDKSINILGREIGRLAGQLDRARSNRQNTDVQDYLATQGKLREKKASRLKAMDSRAIQEIIGSVSKAPIDLAMNIRKQTRGLQRTNKLIIN